MRARFAVVQALFVALLSSTAGCVSFADYSVTIYGEEFIEEGIPASEVADGWAIVFTRFLIAVDGVRATSPTSSLDASGPVVFDLSLPTDGAGTELALLRGQSGTYDTFTYAFAPLVEGSGATGGVDDVASLEAQGASLLVEGRATKGDVAKRFTWSMATAIGHRCEVAAVVGGEGTATSEITIHADHLFYDSLVDDEPALRFDLFASADADDDGEITLDELAVVDIRGEEHYGTGSLPVRDLRAYLLAQSGTLGHIDGEGHCEWE